MCKIPIYLVYERVNGNSNVSEFLLTKNEICVLKLKFFRQSFRYTTEVTKFHFSVDNFPLFAICS